VDYSNKTNDAINKKLNEAEEEAALKMPRSSPTKREHEDRQEERLRTYK